MLQLELFSLIATILNPGPIIGNDDNVNGVGDLGPGPSAFHDHTINFAYTYFKGGPHDLTETMCLNLIFVQSICLYLCIYLAYSQI